MVNCCVIYYTQTNTHTPTPEGTMSNREVHSDYEVTTLLALLEKFDSFKVTFIDFVDCMKVSGEFVLSTTKFVAILFCDTTFLTLH